MKHLAPKIVKQRMHLLQIRFKNAFKINSDLVYFWGVKSKCKINEILESTDSTLESNFGVKSLKNQFENISNTWYVLQALEPISMRFDSQNEANIIIKSMKDQRGRISKMCTALERELNFQGCVHPKAMPKLLQEVIFFYWSCFKTFLIGFGR